MRFECLRSLGRRHDLTFKVVLLSIANRAIFIFWNCKGMPHTRIHKTPYRHGVGAWYIKSSSHARADMHLRQVTRFFPGGNSARRLVGHETPHASRHACLGAHLELSLPKTTTLSIRKNIFLAAVLFVGGFGIPVAQSMSPAMEPATVTNTNAIQSLQQIKTVFVIALENHDWTQICPDCAPQQLLGNPAAPYLNSLVTPGNPNAAQVSCATAYYSAAQGEHPSEPNYIWSEAGTEFGVYTDNDPSVAWGNLFNTTNHLCGQLNASGISWRDYQEDLEYAPAANVSSAGMCPSGSNIYNGSTEFYYAVKHNPMEFFVDTQNQNVHPLAQLFADLSNNAVGRYNWITPDEFNEMHSYLPGGFNYQGVQYTGYPAAIAEGDNFLATVIPRIMASSAYQDHGVIIIWTDETESTDDTNTTLPEIVISPMAKGNAYASSVVMSHSSDLKTMDEIFGLAFQNNTTATANDLSDMFQMTGNAGGNASFTGGGQMMPGAGGFQFTFSGPASQTYQVLASDNLTAPKPAWTTLSSGMFGGTNTIFTDSNAPHYPSRFYIIKSP